MLNKYSESRSGPRSWLTLSLTWLRLVVSPQGQQAEVRLTGLGWTDQPLYKQERRVCRSASVWEDGETGDRWQVAEEFVENRVIFAGHIKEEADGGK